MFVPPCDARRSKSVIEMGKKKLIRKTLIASAAILLVFAVACDNPFDPLEQSSVIKGLTYIDFAGSWERWTSDPLYDGFVITMEYFNEFGDSLEFKDKDHKIVIEFYTQRIVGGEVDDEGNTTGGQPTYDRKIFTNTITFCCTDDDIRIPKDLYMPALAASGTDLLEEDGVVFVWVKVYPPEADPQPMLQVGYPDIVVYKPPVTEVTPNP